MKRLIASGFISLLLNYGCAGNKQPDPFTDGLMPNMNLYLQPKTSIRFDIEDMSKEKDIRSLEGYIKQDKKKIKLKITTLPDLDLEFKGKATVHWKVSSQYNEIPEGNVDFILEMTDSFGQKGEYILPMTIKKDKIIK